MCLDTVDKKTEDWGEYGWKVFDLVEGKLLPLYYGTRRLRFNTEEWISDEAHKAIQSCWSSHYPTGFHYFKNKRDAENYAYAYSVNKVKKIKVKNVVATGTDNNLAKVGVAREIFILPD